MSGPGDSLRFFLQESLYYHTALPPSHSSHSLFARCFPWPCETHTQAVVVPHLQGSLCLLQPCGLHIEMGNRRQGPSGSPLLPGKWQAGPLLTSFLSDPVCHLWLHRGPSLSQKIGVSQPFLPWSLMMGDFFSDEDNMGPNSLRSWTVIPN